MEKTTRRVKIFVDEQGEWQGRNMIKLNRQQMLGIINTLVSYLGMQDINHIVLLLEDEQNRPIRN
jgi:hypothetical protein